ncbi:hypothetical protein FRB99_000809 [Tulasnella sp. 403]|nr:hypothetical protein FRB99_000809 [Tulasnella sp. 403]
MSHPQQAPVQSLPSFAHTFPDIAARNPPSQANSPRPRAGSKRRFDALDNTRDDQDPPERSADTLPRKQKRLKSPAVPPPKNGIVLPQHPSPPSTRSRSSSPSDDERDDVVVKEEELDTDADPSPSRPAFHPPPIPPSMSSSTVLHPAESSTYTYPTEGSDPIARKRRRVTISGAHLQPLTTRSPHPSAASSPSSSAVPTSGNSFTRSPLTPTISPVVMGFNVPKTPQGIPHKMSVDQTHVDSLRLVTVSFGLEAHIIPFLVHFFRWHPSPSSPFLSFRFISIFANNPLLHPLTVVPSQVRSALTLKQQQKALIEARRTNPNASAASLGFTLPLPTPPASSGSAASTVVPLSASQASSATVSAPAENLHSLPQVKTRTRTRAVTVTTGTAVPGTPSVGGRGTSDFVRESTRPTANSGKERDKEPFRDGEALLGRPLLHAPPAPSVPSPPAHPQPRPLSHSQVNRPPENAASPQSRSVYPSPSQPHVSSEPSHPSSSTLAPVNTPATNLLVRRRGPGSGTLGVNTTGIANPGSTVNTGASGLPSDSDGQSSRHAVSSAAPSLTVRTTGINTPQVQTAGPPISHQAQNCSAEETVHHPKQPQPNTIASSKEPVVGRGLLIPRNPMLGLDSTAIRSAPLTTGGRTIIGGRLLVGLRDDWGRDGDSTRPGRDAGVVSLNGSGASSRRTGGPVGIPQPPGSATAPQTPVGTRVLQSVAAGQAVASPTQLTSRHHSQLFPASSQAIPLRGQVPISTTLRTPHVANFTIPPRTAQPPGMGLNGSVAGPSSSGNVADKQSFLNLFGQFFDSLNDAKHLKWWLEGQVAKSDKVIANLERATKDLEAERARLRQEPGPTAQEAELNRLRSRVGELEERLAKFERLYGEDAHRGVGDSNRMDIDHPDLGREPMPSLRRDANRMEIDREPDMPELESGSSTSSPLLQRRPYDYSHGPHSSQGYPHSYSSGNTSHHYQQPSHAPYQQHPPAEGASGATSGRTRSGSTAHRPTVPVPLPPIATLSNGIESRMETHSRDSRRGSLPGLVNLPGPSPPSSGGRSRRESFSTSHPPPLPPTVNLHPQTQTKNSSISPPQRPTLPPISSTFGNLGSSRSPQPGQASLSASSYERTGAPGTGGNGPASGASPRLRTRPSPNPLSRGTSKDRMPRMSPMGGSSHAGGSNVSGTAGLVHSPRSAVPREGGLAPRASPLPQHGGQPKSPYGKISHPQSGSHRLQAVARPSPTPPPSPPPQRLVGVGGRSTDV